MLELLPARTIALTIGSWSIHWYGVVYVLAFGIAAWLLPRLQRYRKLTFTTDDWLLVLIYAMLGVMLGGRLGYVLLYDPEYYFQHPLEIFQLWQGGMASHGGFIGVAVALWLVSQKLKINKRALFDIVVIPAAIGLALGRLGNFINQELYGTITSLPWGINIPEVIGQRHPVQIYEMILDIWVAIVCWWYLSQIRPIRLGRTGALFLLLYGVGRLLISFWRIPDGLTLSLGTVTLYESQLLTIPVIIIGAWLWYRWYATETYGTGEQN